MRRLLAATLLIAACSPSGQIDETSTTSNTVPTTTMAIEETGTTAAAPFSTMEDHVISSVELTGVFGR